MCRNSPRILIYSHDTYGLGHLRRSMLIAEELVRRPERPRVLIATGSPRAQAFRPPAGCDTVKLPSVLKQPDGSYGTRSLGIPLDDAMRLRSDLLVSAAAAFRPDLILVDHSPLGLKQELLPLFESFVTWSRRPKIVLGLRDIVDEVEGVRSAWDRDGVWTHLDELYDRILVYGDPAIQTTASELGLEERFPGRVEHTNYLGRAMARVMPDGHGTDEARSERDSIVLVTAGGGGDGNALLRAYVHFLAESQRTDDFRSTIVTGPFLSAKRFSELEGAVSRCGRSVELFEFVEGIEERLLSASAVITMAGYNSAVEVLAAGVPALFVPREVPRREQSIRAHRLAEISELEVCSPSNLNHQIIQDFLGRALSRTSRLDCPVRLDGLARASATLCRLAGEAQGGGRRRSMIHA